MPLDLLDVKANRAEVSVPWFGQFVRAWYDPTRFNEAAQADGRKLSRIYQKRVKDEKAYLDRDEELPEELSNDAGPLVPVFRQLIIQLIVDWDITLCGGKPECKAKLQLDPDWICPDHKLPIAEEALIQYVPPGLQGALAGAVVADMNDPKWVPESQRPSSETPGPAALDSQNGSQAGTSTSVEPGSFT